MATITPQAPNSTAAGTSAAAAPIDAANADFAAEFATKISQVLDIIRLETKIFKRRSKQKQLALKLLKKLSNGEQSTDEVVYKIYFWIRDYFKKEWYDDETRRAYGGHHTNKSLIELLYYRFQYNGPPKADRDTMVHYRNKTCVRKAENVVKKAAKDTAHKVVMEVANEKKIARRNMVEKQCGGSAKFQAKIKADKDAKEKRDAQNATAQQKAAFWKMRLETDFGKCLDTPMKSVPVCRLPVYAPHTTAKTFSVSTEDALESLNYIVQAGDKKRIQITFKDDAQGRVYYYALALIPTNPNHHISLAPRILLRFQAEVRKPSQISGTITGYNTHGGQVYLCVDSQTICAHRKLPDPWKKCSQYPSKYFSGKRYAAEPHDNVVTPFLLGIQNAIAIESFSWVENDVQFTALVQKYGKNVDYVKGLRAPSKEEQIASELQHLEQQAAREKEEKKREAIAREFLRQQQKRERTQKNDDLQRRVEKAREDAAAASKAFWDTAQRCSAANTFSTFSETSKAFDDLAASINTTFRPSNTRVDAIKFCPYCAAQVKFPNAPYCAFCRKKLT